MTPAMRAFLAARRLAVVGVSRSEEKYGTKVYRVLTEAGYEVYGVNPNLAELDGRPVYPSLSELPVPVEGVVVVIPPAAAVEVIREAARLSIPRVWLQPGPSRPRPTRWPKS